MLPLGSGDQAMSRLRLMRILTPSKGLVWVLPEDDEQASTLGSYWNDTHRFRDTGDTRGLARYAGRKVRGYPFETDPDEIEYWAAQGELDFEDIYEAD
jgi:hypothetical protein